MNTFRQRMMIGVAPWTMILRDGDPGGGGGGDDVEAMKAKLDEALASIKALEANNGRLKGELTNARSAKSDLEETLKAFGGKDKALEALAKLAEDVDEKDKTKGNIDALLERRDAKHKAEVDGLRADNENLSRQLSTLVINSASKEATAKHKGSYELLRREIEARSRVIREDGSMRVEVLDADGQIMLGNNGGPATIEDLVVALRDDPVFSRAFEGSGSGGTGSRGGAGGDNLAPSDNPWITGNLTKQHQILTSDPARAKRLEEQARNHRHQNGGRA